MAAPALFVELLGEKLRSSSGEVATAEALSGHSAVALYFSSSQWMPCRNFSPKLADSYRNAYKAKGLEIVLVSSDPTEELFEEDFKEMPWLALPFAERERNSALLRNFRVDGIPALIVLDGKSGKLINNRATTAVIEDPAGDDLPWRPKKPVELLTGAALLTKDGRRIGIKEAAQGKKAMALYFSAHWCPPCRQFTPRLAAAYTQDLREKGLEIIFVSWDNDEASFKEYVEEMPWLALDYADRKLAHKIGSAFRVGGIPQLIVLDEDLRLANSEGRAAFEADPSGQDLPWLPKAVRPLDWPPPFFSHVPVVVVFCETQDASELAAIEEVLRPIAQRYIDKQQADEEEFPEFGFVMNRSRGGCGAKVRGMASLPCLPPGPHEHDLVQKEGDRGWGCDGCGCDSSMANGHWQCSEGCDFDFCGDCYKKAGEACEKQKPVLVLLNIPDSYGFYSAPDDTEISAASVEKLIADFRSKALQRKQLQE